MLFLASKSWLDLSKPGGNYIFILFQVSGSIGIGDRLVSPVSGTLTRSGENSEDRNGRPYGTTLTFLILHLSSLDYSYEILGERFLSLLFREDITTGLPLIISAYSSILALSSFVTGLN